MPPQMVIFRIILVMRQFHIFHLFFFNLTEVHPLVSSKKDKPAVAGGKKVAGPGRPRNSDSGKRFERSRSGK